MMSVAVLCADCGHQFYVVETEKWKRVCRFCYRKEMDARRIVDDLRAENLRLRRASRGSGLSLDGTRLRQLIHLTHPDKHNNSRTATEITQWLLSLRGTV